MQISLEIKSFRKILLCYWSKTLRKSRISTADKKILPGGYRFDICDLATPSIPLRCIALRTFLSITVNSDKKMKYSFVTMKYLSQLDE